ncbi:outer membrane beta-barrel family protein [Spirosoma endbachense]|uniref:Outer membrane beta-barrel protein n=1 Tax=Spirosoma endbachense TaxID=2666025 RepID=A0A6P1W3Y0_9BACT|nr:outer membrane beta-barrel family protein [Spirosoma endbachense]QHV99725.1 outer membrane beta-barrel protein [Spirosoma endbachense]
MKTSLLLLALWAASAGLYAQSMVNREATTNDSLGTAGQISLMGGLGWYPRSGSSLQLTHRQKRASFYLAYTMTNDKALQQISNDCSSPIGEGFLHTNISMNRVVTQTNHSLHVGADFRPGSKTMVGLLVSGFANKAQIDARYQMASEQGTILSGWTRNRIDGQMLENRRWQQRMANAHVQHAFAAGHSLSFDVDYLAYTDSNPNQYGSQNADETTEKTDPARMNIDRQTPIRIQVMKADYVRPLGKQSTLEVGVKASRLLLLNRVDRSQWKATGWQSDVAFNRNDRLNETIGAAYTNLTTRFSDKTTLAIGLRAEYTNSQMHDAQGASFLNRQYWSLLPTFSLSHKIGENGRYELSYTRQILRSPFDAIASFSMFWDPLLMTGNPALQPTFADIIRASYSVNRFSLALCYSHERNPLSRSAPMINPTNNAIGFGPGNLDRSDALTLSLSLPVTICPWWQTQNSLAMTFAQNSLTLQNKTYHIGQFGGQFNMTHTFRLPHEFTAEVTAWYATPTANEFGRLLSRGEVTVSVQKKLSGNRGTLTASVTDLLWTNQLRFLTTVPELRLDKLTTFALNEPRIVRLAYTRSFGKASMKVNSQRRTASDEERKRVN